ncbi:ankyrin repeat domain-containing protein [Gemmata sp. G18]|uniref:Ankyrin repeat domain-containing protein n=1 Tax=Gemmata palustris TaxID=2822762 RepID=A0ABS5BKS7_9BACT|nr:ankyrin repeat domain-containing protein [Gemmata palustris]MBP3953900.1 ankyrin repeat domain-containing protein [Gemmata palustris]
MFASLILSTALAAPPGAPAPPPAAPVVLDDATRAKLKEVAFRAAREGDAKTLKEYFAAGFAADEANSRSDTLLILATYYGHADAVEVILKQPKVGLGHRNKMGFTALDGAAFKGTVPLAKLLVAAGADVNGASDAGKTPLMLAALTGRTEMVEYLLGAGAKPGAADTAGNTPLSLARTQGAKEVVKLLEGAGKKN